MEVGSLPHHPAIGFLEGSQPLHLCAAPVAWHCSLGERPLWEVPSKPCCCQLTELVLEAGVSMEPLCPDLYEFQHELQLWLRQCGIALEFCFIHQENSLLD